MTDGKIDPNQFRIMVVDDDPAILDELRLAFEDEGYGVVTAESGNRALERLSGGHIDLVLSDIHMPEGDGQFLLRSVREEDPAIPFFIMTGFSDFSAEEALERGCTAFFKKPLDVGALLDEVETALFEVYASRNKASSPRADKPETLTPEGLSPQKSGAPSAPVLGSVGSQAALSEGVEQRLAELERENVYLRRAVADLTLEKMALLEALESKD